MRMFSSALASQAVLSAASLLAGLLLIRRSSDLQYGYYILVSGAIVLAASLQSAFIMPPMVNRMTKLGRADCGDLTGGLYREQRRVVIGIAAAALALTLVLRLAELLDERRFLLVLAAIAATSAALRREYFRIVMLAYHRAHDVLKSDLIYSGLLMIGVLLATLSPLPAALAIFTSGFAALISSLMLSRILHRVAAWNPLGAPGILREIAPLGTWSAAGAGVYWSFSQGYTWLVAGTLDVPAVAAIAAVRLLAMPVNLLSTGIGSLMLPLTSRWLHNSGAPRVLRRLIALALGIAAVAVVYFAVLWILRHWVFEVILHKQFAQRDLLLMLWSASFVLMAVNQQLIYLLVARERFRALLALSLLSATLALASSYWGMQRFGGAGAPLGILIGTFISTVGIAAMCLREAAPQASRAARRLAATQLHETRAAAIDPG